MTSLQLYKFLQENDIEHDWRGDSLISWINFGYLREFTEMIGYGMLDEGGIVVNLQQWHIAIDLVQICDYHGFEPTEILAKSDS